MRLAHRSKARPRPAAAARRVRNAGCRGEHGLEPFADHQLRSGRPELDHAGPAEHAALDLLDPSVAVRSAMRWIPTGSSVSGSRINAIRHGKCVPGPNTQFGWKRRLRWMSAGSLLTSICRVSSR